MSTVLIPTNKYQTSITKELLAKFPDEVGEQFLDFIDTVPLLKWMVSENRPRAKDLPRDDRGRIVVDITHPHILEDMDYFRPAAKFFEQNGCYSLLKPNPNPNSEYGKWFAEEVRRCREGYVRESDGEWITGQMYWYMNYCQIMLNRRSETSGVYLRVEDFPDFWEGIYYRFHYIEQARMLGKHGMELARRGCSKSFSLASMMSHNLILGENSENKRRVTTILTAYTKEYLAAKDGTLTKFTPMVDFCAEHTEFPRLMLKRSTSEMIWQMGYRNTNGNAKGSLNSVMAVSVKDDEGKIRGKRGFVFFEEMGNYPRFLGVWDNVRDSVKEGSHVFAQLYAVGCVCAGTKVWLPDGRNINIEDLKLEDGIYGFDGIMAVPEEIELLTTPKLKECVEIELTNGTKLRCSVDHPIYTQKKIQYRPYLGNYTWGKHEMHFEYKFVPAGELTTKHRVCEAREIPAFGDQTLFDARLVGMLIGDGTYGFNNTPKYSSEDPELLSYVESRYDTGLSASHITKRGNLYKDIRIKGICPELRKIGIYGQTHSGKRLPNNYELLTKNDASLLLAGLYDTDGTFSFSHQEISLCQGNREILEQVTVLMRKFGIFGHISKYAPRLEPGRKDRNPYYRYSIKGRVNVLNFAENIPIMCKHKADTLKSIVAWFGLHPSQRPPQYDTHQLEVNRVKSVTPIGRQFVYNMTVSGSHTYIANNIITHNTAGDKESDFTSIKTVLYNPDAYEVYALENVYDQKGKGTQKFAYFFPSYISRAGCMDKDGNSDVVAALLEILMERYMVKQGGDPASLLSRIAQMPITPAEAILKVKSNFFPVVMLNERLRQLDTDPRAFDDVYVGTLADVGGHVEFRATDDTPIRKWPVDNTERGALEIYTMPPTGVIPTHRFIIGVDPVDNDQAESSSLFSCFVFDLFTDEIVAEYTGRKPFAEDNYEMARLLGVYYNASIMYEAHPYDQTVLVPGGGRKMWSEISVGDTLFAPNGRTVTVTDIPVDGIDDIYKISFSDGRSVEASSNHIWSVYKLGASKNRYTLRNVTTSQMLEEGLFSKHGQKRFFVPEAGCVDYSHKDVPIDPYSLGLLIAEGAFTKFRKDKIRSSKRTMVQFSSCTSDAEHYKKKVPYEIKYIGTKGCSWHMYIDDVDIKLKALGLLGKNSHEKFIPEQYLYNDAETRLELLKGLMDGDGCAVKKGASVFVTTSRRLADDIMLLCRSLGIKCKENAGRGYRYEYYSASGNIYQSAPSYRVAIAAEQSIFSLPRKVEKQHIYKPKARGSKAQGLNSRNGIVSIEYVGKKRCKCVTVSSDDGLYLVGDYVVTHNCNRKGMYAYFAKNHATWMLADCPEYLRDRQLVKYSMFGSAQKGISVNAPLIAYANDLIRDWLNKTYPHETKDEKGEVHIQQIPQLYKLRCRALLQELVSYSPEVNVDRIRALSQVMLYREHYIILYGGSPESSDYDSKDDSDDDFFDRDWNRMKERLGPLYKSAF